MLRPWNNGKVEYWNVGLLKDIILFIIFQSPGIEPIEHYPILPEPIFPSFQYSIIPSGAYALRAGGQMDGRSPLVVLSLGNRKFCVKRKKRSDPNLDTKNF